MRGSRKPATARQERSLILHPTRKDASLRGENFGRRSSRDGEAEETMEQQKEPEQQHEEEQQWRRLRNSKHKKRAAGCGVVQSAVLCV